MRRYIDRGYANVAWLLLIPGGQEIWPDRGTVLLAPLAFGTAKR